MPAKVFPLGYFGDFYRNDQIRFPINVFNDLDEVVPMVDAVAAIVRDDDNSPHAVAVSLANAVGSLNGFGRGHIDGTGFDATDLGHNFAVMFTDGEAGMGGPDLTGLVIGQFSLGFCRSLADLVRVQGNAANPLVSQIGVRVNDFASGLASTSAAQLSVNVLSVLNQSSNASALLSNVASTLTKATALPTWPGRGLKKNVAYGPYVFAMVSSTDHKTPLSGLTVTATRSIDGAAFAACANAVVEIGSSGFYAITFAGSDMNGDNSVMAVFTAVGADPFWQPMFLTP